MEENKKRGGFTLPGEQGYEKLTLDLAERWGADVIRDSDGTQLSGEILNAGYGIYSTICIIRGHNEFAKKHPDMLQQCFLMTEPVISVKSRCEISLLDGYFKEQFRINEKPESKKYWQVYDRTQNRLLEMDEWKYLEQKQTVVIPDAAQWHKYTVNFLVYRIWEEVSMYNHVTNGWKGKEHLMPIDPVYPEVQKYMEAWLEKWCQEHPATTVVRFTSLFYNFAWIWGSSEENRSLFSDWASYDFTVSDYALEQFEKKYGYEISAEDFIKKGKRNVTHMPADARKRDWMEFTNDFVIRFGKRLIEIVHRYGKEAYVFYDDSWVGIEPYHKRFEEFAFDGIIKCVFSGFEVRLCAGVKAKTHEIRLHPYLFPVGLGGAPTFMEGGNPTRDARQYWMNVRRALLWARIQRIGLGGYLHLVEDFPDFTDYIKTLCTEFREIRSALEKSEPQQYPVRIGVLHYWGALRSWTLSGHFHETYMHDLIHINEALAGLPFPVEYIDFSEVETGDLRRFAVIINAGKAGSAWSGGRQWDNQTAVEKLTEWTWNGGIFLGINEPSAHQGFDTCFSMAHVLGVDMDDGARVCHGKWPVTAKAEDRNRKEEPNRSMMEHLGLKVKPEIYLTTQETRVLYEKDGNLLASIHDFGSGKGIYLTGFCYSPENAAWLESFLLEQTQMTEVPYHTDNAKVQCACYPEAGEIIVINHSGQRQKAEFTNTQKAVVSVEVEPYELKVLNI